MVRFVTTAYTQMYDNSYTGRSNMGRGKRTMIGSRVEKMRKAAGLSEAAVCIAVDVSPAMYHSFLDGGYRFDRDQFARLADVLGVSVYDIFHAKESTTPKLEAALKSKPRPHKIHVKKVSAQSKQPDRKQGRTSKPTERAYDADEAAELLAKKFRVKH